MISYWKIALNHFYNIYKCFLYNGCECQSFNIWVIIAFMHEKHIYTICAHGQMDRSASCLLYTGFGRKYVFVIFWHGEMCMLHDSGKKKLLVWKCIKCALHLSTTTVTYPDHGATMHLKNGLKRKQEIFYRTWMW